MIQLLIFLNFIVSLSPAWDSLPRFNDCYLRKEFVFSVTFLIKTSLYIISVQEHFDFFCNCHCTCRYTWIGSSPLISADGGNCTMKAPWETTEIHHYLSQSSMKLLCLYISDILWCVREALQRKQTRQAYLCIRDIWLGLQGSANLPSSLTV